MSSIRLIQSRQVVVRVALSELSLPVSNCHSAARHRSDGSLTSSIYPCNRFLSHLDFGNVARSRQYQIIHASATPWRARSIPAAPYAPTRVPLLSLIPLPTPPAPVSPNRPRRVSCLARMSATGRRRISVVATASPPAARGSPAASPANLPAVSVATSATETTTPTTMDGQGRPKPDREDSSKQLQEPGQLSDATSSSELAGAVFDATSARRGHMDVSRHNLPLSSIVNQASVKEALLAAAVDPGLGGVALVGGHGTAKTVMARALPLLLPPIAIVEGSWANADPLMPEEWEEGLRESIEQQGCDVHHPPVTLCKPPFVQVPLGVTEDRLLGSVDVEASIHAGRNVFLPGLLAQCHRGVLYIDDANLLDDALAALLFAALAEGCSAVEREGLSVRHACRPLLLASFNPQEGALRRHLLDRIALIVSTDAPLSLEQRVAAADVANAFLDGRLTAGGRARGNVGPEGQTLLEEEKGEEGEEEEESVEEGVEADRLRVLFARQLLPRVSISQAQIAFLVDAAVQLECEGQRAELFAVRAAKALAALNGRAQVTQADLVRAAQLAIVPRATVALASEPSSSPPQSARAAPPPPSRRAEDSKEEPQEEQEGEPPEVDEEQLVPASFVVEAEDTRLDAAALQLFQRAARTAGRAGRSKNKIYSEERGRYVKALLPKGKVVRLAVDATLRAAAPLQRVRRERAARTGGRERRIYVDKSDLRRKLLARRASSLVVFIVDASGSMALNRMGAAKGAALQLLAESYSKRDSIAVVPFHDQHADLLVPPSRAVALAHKRLESLPCGGGSPLAHALVVAVRAAEVARRRGDVGQVVAVLITDGRANVPLSTSLEAMEGGGGGGEGATGAGGEEKLPPRLEDIKEEVLSIAAKMGAAGIQLLVIDTENKFVSSGFAKEIAKHSQGKYFYLPHASVAAVAATARAAMQDFRKP